MKTVESATLNDAAILLRLKQFEHENAPSILSKSPGSVTTYGHAFAKPLHPQPAHRHLTDACALGSRSVGDLLKDRVCGIPNYLEDAEDAFFVADVGEIIRQHQSFRKLLPRVEPFYAVKCCPDPMVVKTLVDLGTGFDCASQAEVKLVTDFGVDPARVIYANPCKQLSHVRFASNRGVKMMTFDNEDELLKIKGIHPNAEMVLRILTDDSHSLCQFGVKFGAPLERVPHLLQVARDNDIKLVGVSFHVGSGCFNAVSFADAVKNARAAFNMAKEFGFDLTLLDVGGGFPGNNSGGLTFQEIASVLGPAIDQYFPSKDVRVIAEPGRFFVASAFTLAVNVVARRVVPSAVVAEQEEADKPSYMYYVNDGVYGSFNCLMFDHAVVYPKVLLRNGEYLYESDTALLEEPNYTCSIWGPTCDSIDCISKKESLPELNIGDWMYFENMGAYTLCAASNFNGFRKSSIVYTNTYLA
ncbi:pyridoxal-dependent decarboxylase [Cladochytrium replicatum]|nr:pyridoxal-dependent decarboxylase [Cladochytrium replicatum]